MDLHGKVSLVTGASAGQGQATSRELAAHGATVVMTDVDVERGQALADELGAPHLFLKLDVTDNDDWAEVVADIDEKLGRLDTVHLNAGLMTRPYNTNGFDDPLDWLTAEGYRRTQAVNSDGVVLGIINVRPLMEKNEGGRIIVTSSTAGVLVLPWDPFYAMAKTGVIALVRSLGPLLEPKGVVITALLPEGILSEMCPPDLYALRMKEGRGFGPVEYIAEAAMTILDQGRPGEVWMCRHTDDQFWVLEHQAPPKAGPESREAIAAMASRRFPSRVSAALADG